MAHSFIFQNLIDEYKSLKVFKNHIRHKFKVGVSVPKGLVSMIDGSIHHGGLSDRLCGIVSSYIYCVRHNLPFHLYYVYPYKLEAFLEPNLYDWRINENQMSYSLLKSRSLFVSLHRHNYKKQIIYTDFRIKGAKYFQTHIYSNMYYFENGEQFGEYFRRLFKPTRILEEAIAENIKSIGSEYIAVTFRFQQLMGDFKETGFLTLESEAEREKLLKRCLLCVEYIHSIDCRKLLVTSDSRTFLDIVQNKYEYVYTIPGDLVHMDFVDKQEKIDLHTHLKSFVDLYVLANANVIYLANIKPLYKSSFPMIASWIYNKPRYIIEENNKCSYTIKNLDSNLLVDNK